MKLYINTKDPKVITVTLTDNNQEVNQLTDTNEFGSQVLLPMIVKILKKNNLEFQDIKNIEVETGPGSFTGLKVGAAVANALAFTLHIPVNNKQLESELNYG